MPRTLAALALLVVTACRSNVDPNRGSFTCASATDCGPGYECKEQSAGGGRCFKVGTCDEPEACNGRDDDCDGVVDEDFPGKDEACQTGLVGLCAVGQRACVSGEEQCAQTIQPSTELCDGQDNDCDGSTDEDFDLQVDEAHCGACNQVCTAGSACLGATCQEVNCADSADNDEDGNPDCQDPDCVGQTCALNDLTLNCSHPGDGGTAPDGGSDAGCVARETACDNATDDDGDGRSDCQDPDCEGRACGPGTSCQNQMCPGAG